MASYSRHFQFFIWCVDRNVHTADKTQQINHYPVSTIYYVVSVVSHVAIMLTIFVNSTSNFGHLLLSHSDYYYMYSCYSGFGSGH